MNTPDTAHDVSSAPGLALPAALCLRNIRVVLHHPRGAGNVGAAARVVRNMGLGGLNIVRKQPPRQAWARAMAAHAGDVLDSMRRYETLPEAVADCSLVIGTTARSGPHRRAAGSPRAAAGEIVARAQRQPVALVFGPEDHGLSNAELTICHQLITIPAAAEYPSLNLAQAVMVCGYELFLAAQANQPPPEPEVLAPAGEVERVYAHLREALLSIGFLNGQNPDHIMFALRRLFGRTGLEEREARILLGLARQISWFAGAGGRTLLDKSGQFGEEA